MPRLREMVEEAIRGSLDVQEATEVILRLLSAERRSCAAAVCELCRRTANPPQVYGASGEWWHQVEVGMTSLSKCRASAIWNLPSE
jgi:hypothetical protein